MASSKQLLSAWCSNTKHLTQHRNPALIAL